MPKRGRPKDANPLSSARKDGAGSSSKADQTALSLWHRKSGAGNHLFIAYYGSQPMGVVADDDNDNDTTESAEGVSTVMNNRGNNSSCGMSRAAKRRRQKKTKSNSSSNDTNANDAIVNNRHNNNHEEATPRPRQNAVHAVDTLSSHPLLQAFQSADNKYPHLTKFIHAMSRPLPLTLRFREHEQRSNDWSPDELKEIISAKYSNLIGPVPYNDSTENIYQSTPNSSLCKFNLGKLSPQLKELIVTASMNGTLARQELGSMLPVLCLRFVGAMKGGSKVLDLCASPGSKTMQALEVVSCKSSSSGKKGRVIANDVHSGRLDSLREAVLRSSMPDSITSRVTYTNFDASIFPSPKSGKLFDAIICDVPCGGDGTIRKDKHILPMWSPNISNTIHSLQLKILLRALDLVKVGGVVCYSTCSLNPIEDEAVVSAALGEKTEEENDAAKKFELLEWPKDMLPGFVGRAGVTDWKVAFYDQNNIDQDEDESDFGALSFFESYKSATSAGMEDDARSTFWPNVSGNKGMQLERCMRLFPQDQDTGGFFIALIKRIN